MILLLHFARSAAITFHLSKEVVQSFLQTKRRWRSLILLFAVFAVIYGSWRSPFVEFIGLYFLNLLERSDSEKFRKEVEKKGILCSSLLLLIEDWVPSIRWGVEPYIALFRVLADQVRGEEIEKKDNVPSIWQKGVAFIEDFFSNQKEFREETEEKTTVIKRWQKGRCLGCGALSTVYEAFTDEGWLFAVKEVLLHDQDGLRHRDTITSVEQEISFLSRLQHSNIVRYLGSSKDDSKFYIFLEMATGGSIQSLYKKYEIPDPTVAAFTRQILNGLNYLHSQNVVHRDIKCANILVDASGSVKLADFGLAKTTTLNDIISCKGTPFWMAPEVVNPKKQGSIYPGYGIAADIWSIGCTLLEMLTRKTPYSDLEQMQALFRIGKGIGPEVPNNLSRNAQDFIHSCLKANPDDRPTAAQLLEHPFVKNS